MSGLLLPEEVAERLRMSKRTVLDELRRKNLRGSRTPSGWRISEEDVEAYRVAHLNVSPVRKVGRAS